jgi:hypothetical protein
MRKISWLLAIAPIVFVTGPTGTDVWFAVTGG